MTGKPRTQDDVVDAVHRWGKCSIFLGAGVSVASGIPSAWNIIVALGRKLLDDENLTPEEVISGLLAQPFYDHEHAYASLLDAAFPSEAERAQYFEGLIAGKQPTAAHQAVANLAGHGYAPVLVTTNFDRLMEYAVFESCRHIPCVLPTNQVPEYLNMASRRAKILKLHGDYLYGNIRNLDHELYQVKVSATRKLELAASEPVMIVAGYSGGDSSVMEVLKSLAGDPSNFRGGIFWLHLPEKMPDNKDIEWLLEATGDKGSGFVEIANSDSFFVKLERAFMPNGISKLPPLPENPHKFLIDGPDRIREFLSERLEPLEASEFLGLLKRRATLAPLARSAAGLDYLVARYEELGELPGNVGELLDGYADLLAGGSAGSSEGRHRRRIGQMRRLGLIGKKPEEWPIDFALLRNYAAALALAETNLEFDKLADMLDDDEAYEVLRCYVGLVRDARGIIQAAVNTAAQKAGICGRHSPWTKSFYRAAALCGCGSNVDVSLVELVTDWLILEFDTEKWPPCEAIEAISQMGSAVVDQLIQTVLLDRLNDTYTREDAALALGSIGTRRVVDRLRQAGRNASPRDSKMLVYALGNSGNPRAIEAIAELAKNVDPSSNWVVQNALNSLGYIGGGITATGPGEGPPPRPKLDIAAIIRQYIPEAEYRMPIPVHQFAGHARALLRAWEQFGAPADIALAAAGQELRDVGRLFEAEAVLAECLDRYPIIPAFYHNLALVLMRQGRLSAARRYYSTGLRLKPDYSDYYNDFAITMWGLHDPEAARLLLVTGLGIDFENYRLWFNLANINLGHMLGPVEKQKPMRVPGGGLVWSSEGPVSSEARFADARICLRRVLALKPDHAAASQILKQLGRSTDELGDRPPTPQELLEVLHLGEWVLGSAGPRPEDVPLPALSAMERAGSFWSQGNIEEALTAMRQAHAIYPNSIHITHNIALALSRLNDLEAAISVQEQALKIAPWDYEHLLNYGGYLQKAGKYREAIVAFQKAIRVKPDASAGWFALADGYFAAGKIAQARDTARHAGQLSSPWVWARVRGDRLLEKLHLGEAEELGDRDAVFAATLVISDGLYRRGQFEDSLVQARKALEIAESLRNALALGRTHVMLGQILRELGQPQTSLAELEAARNCYMEIGEWLAVVQTIIAECQILYFDLHKNEDAIAELENAAALAKAHNIDNMSEVISHMRKALS